MTRNVYLKYLLTTAVAVTIASTASGQDINSFRNRLFRPAPASGATVTITEHGSAADAIRRYDNVSKSRKVQGYRIGIFFDNKQNAREGALGAQARFRNEFPGIPTHLVHESPSFTVTVGNCVTLDEALILWARVKRSFDTAFLWRGEIVLDEVLKQESLPPAETETSDGQTEASTN